MNVGRGVMLLVAKQSVLIVAQGDIKPRMAKAVVHFANQANT
jgi:L-lactate utilization protein LutC